MHENSKRPVVHSPVMSLVQDDLWCNIFWCSTECPRFTAKAKSFGKAKVNLHKVKFVGHTSDKVHKYTKVREEFCFMGCNVM
jgi:hypothetical protein